LAAISYDSIAILKEFTDRQGITYPMLSDPGSAVIVRYGLLNREATGMQKGIPHPGFFLVDPSGRIQEKYFEDVYTDRFTPNSVLGRLVPGLLESQPRKLDAPHLQLALQQSDTTVGPGSRVSLIVDVTLPKNVHVYAPGAKGYIPVKLDLDSAPDFSPRDPEFPQPRILYLAPIKERVPVFEGRFRIRQDVVINATREYQSQLGAGKTLTVKGTFKYQACDDKICYLPSQLALNWTLSLKPLDRTRSPEAIRHQ